MSVKQRARDERLARALDGVKPGTALLATERFELLDRCGLSEVVPKNRMSMSSEKRSISPNDFDSEVPPLNSRRGVPSGGR